MTDWYDYPISHGYIPQYEGANTDTPHYAFDLAVPMDTPVWFPVSGTVEQADYAVWSGKQGGGEVFIKPDNGWPEEYMYHLDQINVQPGEHLEQGQIVGLSGGQNSGGQHPTDPMWSSGEHLHIGEFDNYVSTPDGTRPYGNNPSYIIDMAKLINLSGGIDARNNLLSTETKAVGTPVDTAVAIQQGFGSFLTTSNLTRIGIFALGGLIIIGGMVILAGTSKDGKETISVVSKGLKAVAA